MAKAKISSKDFLDLLDEQNDHPAPALGSFGRTPPALSTPLPNPGTEPLKQEPLKNGLKTGHTFEHKPNTNRTQTGHTFEHKPDTNRAQTGHNSSLCSEVQKETEHKPDTQPDTHSNTNRTQTAHKQDTKSGFSSLVGLQRELAIFVYQACQYARAQETNPLTLEHIATSLKIRTGSVKTTLRRLEEKRILERVEFRVGRGGWSKYRLPETIFLEMLRLETGHKLDTNRTQTGHKVDTQPDTQPDTSLSSSSSSLILEDFKTTTTSGSELFESAALVLSHEWRVVDCSPLAEIGFTETHLNQLAKHGKLAASEVQDSIHFFAFDLKRNGKGRELKGPPLNFFMGIIRKGLPYAPPENYESPEQVARRIYLDGKRRIEEQRLAEEREIRDLEFSEWRRGLTQAQITGLVPDVVRDIAPARESSLKVHFEEQVWPTRSTTVAGTVAAEREEVRRQVEQSLGEVQP